MTEKPTRRPRVLIVGAGFGGLAAAKRLAGQPVDVTIIDQRNYHLFQPLLYQVATAALSPADVAWPFAAFLRITPTFGSYSERSKESILRSGRSGLIASLSVTIN